MLSERDKSKSMSDTTYYSEMFRGAFPKQRHGGAKAAIYAGFRFIAPRVTKTFTERRARAIWEGTARRINAEEAAAMRLAEIEEAKREQQELRARLAWLDEALAVADEEFHGETRKAMQSQMGRLRGMDLPGAEQ